MTEQPKLRRRTLLAAAGAAGVTAAGSRTPATAAPNWQALRRQLDGRVIGHNDNGYVDAVKTFDPRRDGLRPLAIVRCASADDVQATVRFARKYDLRPRPRAGGHSYTGGSTGNGVLVIDTSRMDQISYRAGSHQVQVRPGAQLGDLHQALDQHGRTVPTGTCPTVGTAGLTMGGGFGTESRLYGLTSDLLAEATLVLANGHKKTVNRQHNADLYWAIRGGGGGNFGVLTRLVFNTRPARAGEIFRLSWPSGAAKRVLLGWQERIQGMSKFIWSNVHLDSAGGDVNPSITGVCWDRSATAEIKKLVSAIGRTPSSRETWSVSHPEAMDWFAGSNGDVRQSWFAGSDVVQPAVSGATADKIISAVGRWRGNGSVAAIFDPAGGLINRPASNATAFRWRYARAFVQWYVGLGGTGSGNLRHARDWVNRCHRAIGGSARGGYVNYIESGRPMKDYYGGNWNRLLEINKKYDPTGFFDGGRNLP